MGARGGYGQFCPVSMAAEILCTRWTVLLLREMLCGSTRFNDLRRGVPRMSPALLSRRLKELERAGIVTPATDARGLTEYRLSPAGEALRPIVIGFGDWGQRWVESRLSLRNLDPSLLMWDMRRNLDPSALPPGRHTIRFEYPELPEARRRWWLVVEDGTVDLCSVDPGHPVDLYVTVALRSMTAIWMGLATVGGEERAGRLERLGTPAVADTMQRWLGLSPFARDARPGA